MPLKAVCQGRAFGTSAEPISPLTDWRGLLHCHQEVIPPTVIASPAPHQPIPLRSISRAILKIALTHYGKIATHFCREVCDTLRSFHSLRLAFGSLAWLRVMKNLKILPKFRKARLAVSLLTSWRNRRGKDTIDIYFLAKIESIRLARGGEPPPWPTPCTDLRVGATPLPSAPFYPQFCGGSGGFCPPVWNAGVGYKYRIRVKFEESRYIKACESLALSRLIICFIKNDNENLLKMIKYIIICW